MIFYLLTLKNKETGETRYTFEHWINKDNEYMTTVDRPSHKTQLLTNYHKDFFDIIQREEYTDEVY